MNAPVLAVMQPYFFPYAGYYRLLAAADIFVIFDCVQFPRRGWVHRNRLTNTLGQLDWLTLPLAKADYLARISELRFAENAPLAMEKRLRAFPTLVTHKQHPLTNSVTVCEGSVVDYLEHHLRWVMDHLGIPMPLLMRSSRLDVPRELHAAERIIWIAKELNARTYINAPGGRSLYNQKDFSDLQLKFLMPFNGPTHSMLERILMESNGVLRSEIYNQCKLED